MSIEYTYPSSSPTRIDVTRGYIDEVQKPNNISGISKEERDAWGDDGFGVDDFLDLINPLQHIPVVSTLYREITGDTIKPGAQIIGGGIFGGVTGLVSAGVNAVIDAATGADISEHALAIVSGDVNIKKGDNVPISTAPTQAATSPERIYASLSDLPPPPDLSPLRDVRLGLAMQEAAQNVTMSIEAVHVAAHRYRAVVARS